MLAADKRELITWTRNCCIGNNQKLLFSSVFILPNTSMENAEKIIPEIPEYIMEISVWIERYAKGDIPFDTYQSHLDRWYEKIEKQ